MRQIAKAEKDSAWRSVRENLAARYSDAAEIIAQCHNIIITFKSADAESNYHNFGRLAEDFLTKNCLKYDVFAENSAIQDNQIMLSLFIRILYRRQAQEAETMLLETFAKGLNYYQAWTIMLLVLLSIKGIILSEKVIAILLIIETNDFYGLKVLKVAIKQYWSMKMI